MVKLVCDDVEDLNPSNTLNETLHLVNEEPCLSAVAWVAVLKIEDLFPIPIVFEEQERILKKTSTQVVMDWDKTMAVEMREMQDICRLADIDFDFVIDQSGSVGESEWRKTMNIIAKN